MSPLTIAYGSLLVAILFEVTGSSLLQKSEQFSRLGPTIGMAVCFLAALFFLSQALKAIPLGVAYAIWSGIGVVLTALIGVVVFRFALDAPCRGREELTFMMPFESSQSMRTVCLIKLNDCLNRAMGRYCPPRTS